jgi:hypothetical protein
MVWQRPGLIGNPGRVRSSAWIWLFSSSESTTACASGSRMVEQERRVVLERDCMRWHYPSLLPEKNVAES